MNIDINKAIKDFKTNDYPTGNEILSFTDSGKIEMLKPIYQYSKFDILNISKVHRGSFKVLMRIMHDLDLNSYEKLDDDNIKFILTTYYKFFKPYYSPNGSFTPDIYHDMSEVIGRLFNVLGSDLNNITLLESLVLNIDSNLVARAKKQLELLYNLQLKNRDFDNNHYKSILDKYQELENDYRFFDYEKLKNDLIDICLHETENRKVLSDLSEDEINDRFRTDLSLKKYFVNDQSRGGESESGKKVGERDIVIRNKESGIVETVIEAYNLTSLNRTVIEQHYQKLINKYDTTGNKQNYILVYSKTKQFDELWNRYKENYDIAAEIETNKDNLKVGSKEEGNMKVVHMFINLYSPK